MPVVTSQADADEFLAEETDAAIRERKKEDCASLLPAEDHFGTPDQLGPVRGYETEVVRALSTEVDVVTVNASGVAEAFKTVRGLEQLVEARGEGVPPNSSTPWNCRSTSLPGFSAALSGSLTTGGYERISVSSSTTSQGQRPRERF